MSELKDFNWQESGADDFFGIKEETQEVVETPEVKEEIQEEIKKEKPETEETQEEEELSFFEEKKPEIKTEEKTEVQETGKFWNDAYEDFKSNGAFKHVELEEGEELDSDKFFELQQKEYEEEVKARLQQFSEELDDDAKAFLKFKSKGGSTEEFFKVYSDSTGIPSGDIEDEDYQDAVIRYRLQEEGWDKEEIEDRLSYLTDKGNKKSFASKYDEKNKKLIEKQKEEVLKSQQELEKAQKEQEIAFKNSMKTTLDSTDKIGDFNIRKEKKDTILNFMTRKSYKVEGSNKSITAFQKKLGDVLNDPEKTILLASLLESDFDVSDINKKARTQQTQKIKSKMEQSKGKTDSTGSSSGLSLADLIS